jgi:hypothetical protein
MEPMDISSVVSSPDHGERIFALEGRMSSVERAATSAATLAATAAANAKVAADNTDQILAFMTAAKGTVGFVKKHGPRFVAFGVGIMSAFGYSNPKLNAVLHTIF